MKTGSFAPTLTHARLPPALSGTGLLVTTWFERDEFSVEAFDRHGVHVPQALQRAAVKRQAEYLAGRLCVRQALVDLGCTPAFPFMLESDGRRPCWPAGFTGALTHSPMLAGAWMAHSNQVLALGLDAEPIMPTARADRLAPAIVSETERVWLARHSGLDQATALTLVFSAKESLFKALNPITGVAFYFHDAELTCLCLDTQEIRLKLLTSLSSEWPAGREVTLYWQYQRDHLLTFLALPA
ncbi:4'-phosphopantetheinyl transferase family protein [Larsenimonas suaedae]|uniref:Enterobactin synthase component D n=1 Tax=Larsenimonas suaedae TaxID=1851019 RepID=A0ABU1GU37_9GAMM|nr:4'-phosphopantetheinyl transferase superfamily protein [Larsenimonas suaedae]MCM2971808.1 4'-phosphopantetheinyl transferase superfamily protein [Larsenimonas suaedae]MDR5895360.1 4'-phosphopantetheinyl transferase superfamily protein [Larsenimonas suaedae]